MTETNTEAVQEENGFNAISAKEQQKRDSIMNELYNEISSSDDEEEEDSAAKPEPKATPAAASTTTEQAKKP